MGYTGKDMPAFMGSSDLGRSARDFFGSLAEVFSPESRTPETPEDFRIAMKGAADRALIRAALAFPDLAAWLLGAKSLPSDKLIEYGVRRGWTPEESDPAAELVLGAFPVEGPETAVLAAVPLARFRKIRRLSRRMEEVRTPEELQAMARANLHLVKGPDGAFIGSPGIRTMRELQDLRGKLRRHLLEASMKIPPEARTWFTRMREFFASQVPEEFQDQLALAMGYTSGQVPLAVNTAAGLSVLSQNLTRESPIRLPGIPSGIKAARETLKGSPLPAQMRKLTPYAEKMSPAREPNPLVAVNDVWIQKVFGYDRALNPAQHRFVNAELARLADWANRNKLWGYSDWNLDNVQATLWVYNRAIERFQGLSEKSRTPEKWAEIVADSVGAYPYHFRNIRAYHVQEAIPAERVGHLPGIEKRPEGQEYAHRVLEATFPGGRDPLLEALGYPQDPSVPAQGIFEGVYTPARGTPAPASYFVSSKPVPKEKVDELRAQGIPVVERQVKGETVYEIPPRYGPGAKEFLALTTIADPMIRANVGGGISTVIPVKRKGRTISAVAPRFANSIWIDRSGPLSLEEAKTLELLVKDTPTPNLVDTGQGVIITNFFSEVPPDAVRETYKSLRDPLQQFGESPRLVRREGEYIEYPLQKELEGTGTFTRYLLSTLEQNPVSYERINRSRKLGEVLRKKAEIDREFSARTGLPLRQDIMNFLDIAGNAPGGMLDALKDALSKGAYLPALVLGAGASLPGFLPDPEGSPDML